MKTLQKVSEIIFCCSIQHDTSHASLAIYTSHYRLDVDAAIKWFWHDTTISDLLSTTEIHEKYLTHMQTDRQEFTFHQSGLGAKSRSIIILTGWVQSWNSNGGQKYVCAEDKERSKEKAKSDRGKSILALGTIQSWLLGHVNGRCQKGPVRGRRHHAGCEAQRTVQQFSLKIPHDQQLLVTLRGKRLLISHYDCYFNNL